MRHFLYSDRVALERDVICTVNLAYPNGFRLMGLTPAAVARWLELHTEISQSLRNCLCELSTVFLHVEYDSLSGFEREVQKRQAAARLALSRLKLELRGAV